MRLTTTSNDWNFVREIWLILIEKKNRLNTISKTTNNLRRRKKEKKIKWKQGLKSLKFLINFGKG